MDYATWKDVTSGLVAVRRTDVRVEDIPGDVLYDAFLKKMTPDQFAGQATIPTKSSLDPAAADHIFDIPESPEDVAAAKRQKLIWVSAGLVLLVCVVAAGLGSKGGSAPGPTVSEMKPGSTSSLPSTLSSAALGPAPSPDRSSAPSTVGGTAPVGNRNGSAGDTQPPVKGSVPTIGFLELQPISPSQGSWRVAALWSTSDPQSAELLVDGQPFPIASTALEGTPLILQDGDTVTLRVRNAQGQAESSRTFTAPSAPIGGAGSTPGSPTGATTGGSSAGTTSGPTTGDDSSAGGTGGDPTTTGAGGTTTADPAGTGGY